MGEQGGGTGQNTTLTGGTSLRGRMRLPPGPTMLTDHQCKNATCPPDKARVRLADSGGLYLEVSLAGSKRWFWKYRLGGKEGRLALGAYPAVALSAARRARDVARLKKADGIDPAKARRLARLKALNPEGDSFKVVALEWFAKQEPLWSESHATRAKRQLERDLFPWIGDLRIAEIEPVELLATLRKIEQRGALETADRALMISRQIWRYAVATGRVSRDMTGDLRGALSPYRGTHLAAITDPEPLGVLLRAIHGYKGGVIVRAALQLSPILFQRPGELRGARWTEMDLAAGMWTIPAARMKRTKDGKEHGQPHLVPLPRQAVAILEGLKRYTGNGEFVFPGASALQADL